MTDAVEVLRIDSLEDERLDAYVRLTERELRGPGSRVRGLDGAYGAADGL